MIFTTNIPKITIDDAGIHVPAEEAVLSGVLADFNQAFGGNMNMNLDTPQGQLASSLTAIIADCYNQLATLMNQVNPDYAEGAMQDAIAKIYFLERKPETDSVVYVEFMGLPGTTIPKGFIVKDTLGNTWELSQEVSILKDGVVTGIMKSSGGIEAAPHTVNVIYQSIVGLDRVDNPSSAIPGLLTESRAAFRDRMKISVAKNSNGTSQSVYSNVFSLDGVSDVFIYDNRKNTPLSLGSTNYSIAPHSVYVAVSGGEDEAIARTILTYAGGGCDFNGNTTITIEDDNYSAPKPSYEVKFMRPEPTPVFFKVKIERGAPIGYQQTVQKAIIDTFVNGDGRARIGSKIYAMRFIEPVNKSSDTINILDIEISLNKGDWKNSILLGIDQQPVISSENIEVIAE